MKRTRATKAQYDGYCVEFRSDGSVKKITSCLPAKTGVLWLDDTPCGVMAGGAVLAKSDAHAIRQLRASLRKHFPTWPFDAAKGARR